MTHDRRSGFEAATWRALNAVGAKRLAAHLDLSLSWLYRAANPAVEGGLSLTRALDADIVCAQAGAGTPHYDAMTLALAEAGSLRGDPRLAGLKGVIGDAIDALGRGLSDWTPHDKMEVAA